MEDKQRAMATITTEQKHFDSHKATLDDQQKMVQCMAPANQLRMKWQFFNAKLQQMTLIWFWVSMNECALLLVTMSNNNTNHFPAIRCALFIFGVASEAPWGNSFVVLYLIR